MAMWTLDEGVRLVRAIQDGAKERGFHVTLGGGVVNKGESDHDVDLYFFPLKGVKKGEDDTLLDWLESLWGRAENLPHYFNGRSQDHDELDTTDTPVPEPTVIPAGETPTLRDFLFGGENRFITNYYMQATAPAEPEIFRQKVKFYRGTEGMDRDRIDVFIV